MKHPTFYKGGPKDRQILPADAEDGEYLIFKESTPWAYYRRTEETIFDEQAGEIPVADYVGEHPQ